VVTRPELRRRARRTRGDISNKRFHRSIRRQFLRDVSIEVGSTSGSRGVVARQGVVGDQEKIGVPFCALAGNIV
jgi:hypothetical protein